MGAWSIEVLSNDTALDKMFDFKKSKNIKEDVRRVLHSDSYIDEILLAVSIVDVSLNGLDKYILGHLYDYDEWFNGISKMDLSDLRNDAIQALKYVQKNDDRWFPSVKIKRAKILNALYERLAQDEKQQSPKQKDME